MNIDLRTVSLKPLRHTYGHIARRFGDKPASRYQEGTYDLQATANFHYRPTWEPQYELFDASRSAIRMADWYALKDPRQFYYGAYTIARARSQEIAEDSFKFVEDHDLVGEIDETLRHRVLSVLVPLRHVAWAANMNNAAIGAYGYGAALAQAAVFHAMDHLAIAQYLTRIGLVLHDDPVILDQAKAAWQDAPHWQGLRHYVEDSLVIKDPVELHVAQNLVLDGLMYALLFDQFATHVIPTKGGATVASLTRFMSSWSEETRKWVDATIKAMAAESDANREVLQGWLARLLPQAVEALRPVAGMAFDDKAQAMLDAAQEQLQARLAKSGL
ncbi:phenol hydroxylase [Castellaniella defragrans]|uniref:phenol hydroxylase n=1 Tax=Castellaniella defragrans TaxID=75697 RepID=UPI002AFEEAFC|nr:phenol hydroxylase [Castellaniella defragrans]